jgi:hypothetical protein
MNKYQKIYLLFCIKNIFGYNYLVEILYKQNVQNLMSAQTVNIIYDTNYTKIISNGGFVNHEFQKSE